MDAHPAPVRTSSTTVPRTRHTTSAQASTTVAQPADRPVAELCAAWRQKLLPTSAPGFLQLANAAGGEDNVTAVLIKIEDQAEDHTVKLTREDSDLAEEPTQPNPGGPRR